jgi:proteasome lid subunit RPN8/RPN11
MQQVVQNRDFLLRRAIQGAPNELCGFIMMDGSVVEIPNAATDPTKNFRMARWHLVARVPDPKQIFAIWHTHPNGNSTPSLNDMQAIKCGAVQYDWVYLVVTQTGVFEHQMKLEDDKSITVRSIAR